jgi:hypothetical protein
MVDRRAGFETYRTIKDLWEMMDEGEKKDFEVLSHKNKWTFIEQWEVWLRRRFCESDKYKLRPLPNRPKTAYRYYFDRRH